MKRSLAVTLCPKTILVTIAVPTLQQCDMYDKCTLHPGMDIPDLLMAVTLGVRLSPVTADYAARTLHNSEIKNNLMLHNSNMGLTLWAAHTILLLD